ncbi:MAG: ATP-binding protein [Ferruginibacter sp.]|nr:ATP-binding protein [Ferruginibacter sp.]
MRFLNKIIFINSATIQYAEVMVDGNVHLIGTQGVGKSTLLRAILFFYNADTLKLGISKEKKNFAEYYFPFQNSFLIYEVLRETGPFCIVAFKSQGKVCFRFLDTAYNREHFVSAGGHAFEKWEDNRQVLDAQHIDHSRKIDRYEEYRDILYGNYEAGKKDFAKYALLQSKQYQNIPRTIQNVFLNSKLEAEFIKQTIIMSLNEEDISIDLQSYTHHLKNFESQLNDIHLYKQPHIIKQADNVVKNHLAIKHLESEKNNFSLQLAWAAAQVQRSIPKLQDKKEKLLAEKKELIEKTTATEQRFRNKADKIKGEISVLENDIKKAKEKADYYSRQSIDSIIERVAKKKELDTELQKLTKEKALLTTRFADITQKYESLLQAAVQGATAYEQDKKEELTLKEKSAQDKEDIRFALEKSLAIIKQNNAQSLQQARQATEQEQQLLEKERLKRATITHQRFFEKELGDAKDTVAQYQLSIQQNKHELEHLKNTDSILQKQWAIEETAVQQTTLREQEKLQAGIAIQQELVNNITQKLASNETALYGWLYKNKPGWENSIGKIANEELLFNEGLSPKLNKDHNNFYGIELDVSDMPVQIKTLAEYKAELQNAERSAEIKQKQFNRLQTEETAQLEKLKKKYQPQIKDAKDSLLTKQYKQEQDELQWEQAKLQQKDYEVKATEARRKALEDIDVALGAASEALAQAQQNLQQTEDDLNKQAKAKEREYAKKIAGIDLLLNQQLAQLQAAVKNQQATLEQQQQEIKKNQQQELAGKGADTKRIAVLDEKIQLIHTELKFIEDKRDLVAEYKKDKKELIDKADGFKSSKANLDKQYLLEEEKFSLYKEKIAAEIKETDTYLNQIEKEIFRLEADTQAISDYHLTNDYLSLSAAYTEEKENFKNEKACVYLIGKLSTCFGEIRNRFSQLSDTALKFVDNFSDDNVFKFTKTLPDNYSRQLFAEDLNEFIQNSKIEEYEKRVNERFANVIKLVGKETGDLMSKAGDIQKVITSINKDFDNKNFVGAIRKIELKIETSANKVVQLLMQIKVYNDEHAYDIGGLNLFSSTDQESKNKKAVELLKQLSKAISEYRKDSIALSDSFELKFRIEENLNDTGWVEKLSNVGSEGTDVLVKAMINIMLLNVFKEGASKRFKDFRLHCMMDEIGKLHPNNIRGILQFANDRNILLINGSPTETNALNYKHIYKLEKDDKRNTKIKRIITQLNPV